MKFPESLLKLKRPKHLWPLHVRVVRGHSMMPVLPPGTLVVGWRWVKLFKPGDIIIFCHEGKEKIKRISDRNATQVFVVGDHDIASTDSRHWGWIDVDEIQSRLIWPHAPKHRAEGVERDN